MGEDSEMGDKNVLRIGELEFRAGDTVNFDNGDGIEKDWKLLNFTESEVTVCKAIGRGLKDIKHTMYDGDMTMLTKVVRIDTFTLQNKK